MIQVAINGNRMDPIVPKTTLSIVESAKLAIKKGADSIHFHPRDENGKETLDNYYVGDQIAAIREAINHVPMGISTGEWIEPEIDKRLELIKSWEIIPDFVSINYNENGAEKVTQIIVEKGIQIEVGLNNIQAAEMFTNLKFKNNVLRILIEPDEQNIETALETITKIEIYILEKLGSEIPILLHGFENTCWSILRKSFEKKYQSRIGFEDTLYLPGGEKAKSNSDLIEHALRIKNLIK